MSATLISGNSTVSRVCEARSNAPADSSPSAVPYAPTASETGSASRSAACRASVAACHDRSIGAPTVANHACVPCMWASVSNRSTSGSWRCAFAVECRSRISDGKAAPTTSLPASFCAPRTLWTRACRCSIGCTAPRGSSRLTASSVNRISVNARSSSGSRGIGSADPVISLGATSSAWASATINERRSSARSPDSRRERYEGEIPANPRSLRGIYRELCGSRGVSSRVLQPWDLLRRVVLVAAPLGSYPRGFNLGEEVMLSVARNPIRWRGSPTGSPADEHNEAPAR